MSTGLCGARDSANSGAVPSKPAQGAIGTLRCLKSFSSLVCSVGTDNLADMFNYAAILSQAAKPGFNLDQADGYFRPLLMWRLGGSR
jgi:hypothetical protein